MIMNKWILKLGAPKEIHVDCGKAFKPKGLKEFAKSMEIELILFYSTFEPVLLGNLFVVISYMFYEKIYRNSGVLTIF